MVRPKLPYPTPAELEVLQILWDHGPLTVREVMGHQQGDRGYTTVMSLLQVMYEKGLLSRKAEGRAFRYSAKAQREKTLRRIIGDLLGRAFSGSSSALVVQLLEQAHPDEKELSAIRAAIEAYEQNKEGQ
ncbi:MAG: BlaI/MecI/CopY family transcriptional regulator [Pirellulaceae bacterium]|nr:BlaI/MecI/CopY family transcriptional regulator [Planctomycetales bacterium]